MKEHVILRTVAFTINDFDEKMYQECFQRLGEMLGVALAKDGIEVRIDAENAVCKFYTIEHLVKEELAWMIESNDRDHVRGFDAEYAEAARREMNLVATHLEEGAQAIREALR